MNPNPYNTCGLLGLIGSVAWLAVVLGIASGAGAFGAALIGTAAIYMAAVLDPGADQ